MAEKEDELLNNNMNLAYICKEMKVSRKLLDEHEPRFEYFSNALLNHKKIRAMKFYHIGKFVRSGFDLGDLQQESDRIILSTAFYYFGDKTEGEIIAYLGKVFPLCLRSTLGTMRSKERSLDDVEGVEEFFDKNAFKGSEISLDVRNVIDGLKGPIREVAELMLQGYNQKEIERKLGLSWGMGWYLKERLAEKLKHIVADDESYP